MSEAAELNQDGQESVTNGSLEKRIGDAEPAEVEGDEGEESDNYEEIDDEEERQIVGDEDDEEDEGEEVEKQEPNTLTHLLLANTNGATAENEAEYEEEYDEEIDEGDDDDDDEYVEEDEDYAAPPNPLTKKRSIDEVADDETSQGSKKLKA
ncbi:hypothetical protein BYT27DRAFT_7190275 [Phlegmacium glaucopus]|nr:hypothetical protein BYT27DRAFT_7190275 [Phlegmacium glaucopus]